MKLKPLLKTHWLSSQNPMTVSLGGLKSVVFAPPPGLLNFSFSSGVSSRGLAPASEARKLPASPEETRQSFSNHHAQSRDLFWTLFSGLSHPAWRAPAAALVALASSLEFHFEDGEILSPVGIFRREGFPLFLDPRFYLQDRSPNWERTEGKAEFLAALKVFDHQKRSEDFKKTWFVILEILAWALQRQRQLGDLEVLAADSSRRAWPLEEVEFLPARPLAATVMSDSELKNAARITLWHGLEQPAGDGVLKFYSVGALAHLENNWPQNFQVKPAEKARIQETAPGLDWEPLFLTVESRQFSESLSRLERLLGRDHIHFVNPETIGAGDFKPVFRLRESEGSMQAAVSFRIGKAGLEHLNFPFTVSALFAAFRGGLDHFFGVDRKEAASRQSLYRANDLLILRHNGLLLFCLLEFINWKLGRPLSSGESIPFVEDLESPEADRSFDRMLRYLKNAVPGLLGKPGANFEEIFSGRVKSYFLEYLEKLFLGLQNDRLLFFEGDRVLEISHVYGQVLPLVRFLLLHFTEESRGKFLTRTTSTIAEGFRDALKPWADGRLVKSGSGEDPLWVDIGLYNKYIVALLFDLNDRGVEVELNGAPFVSQDNPFEILFSVRDGENSEDTNLFDLHPQIFFNGQRVSPEEVQFNFTPDQIGFIEYRGQMYRIDKKEVPSLKSLQKFWNRIRGVKEGSRHNAFGDRVYSLDKSVALELLMLKQQGIKVEASGQWKKVFDYFESGLGQEKIDLPERMFGRMLPHQRDGAQWLHDLYELRLGAILADEMGLGKTFQVLGFLESLRLRGELKKSLVVVPTSLVYNWVDEKKKFSPELPLQVFISADREKLEKQLQSPEPLVLVTTYGLLNENIDFFASKSWNVLAFDEAQNLKNITALRSVSARKLKADFKVCLTGTPMENNYLEFYSLCDLVVPGCLGGVDAFRRTYYNGEVKTEALRELRLISKPLLLRRTKAQVKLSLPVKTLHKVLLPFGEKQREIYKKMAMTYSRQVDDLIQERGERKAQIAMFAALMRLRQICSDPAAVPGVVFEEKPVKIEHFLNSLQDHLQNGESVIVFTQFLSTLSRLERELALQKIPAYVLQGRIKSKERLKLIEEFQNSSEPGVMLMTLKTGGVGLNLTKASVVYHLEPWWNPAVENQASDRAHRMGQTKDVSVYNLLIEGSLEERIADLKVKKQSSFDRLFGVEEGVDEISSVEESGLSREDFLYLLKSDV